MDLIKVSVVIAAYNSEKYIRQTLDSIIGQTLKDIEIICVDDGSSDSTLDVLHYYASLDSRIRVLRHMEQSDGAAAARNMGISHAQGEYLSVLDADDYFESDMLEKAYERAKATDADVLLYDGWVFDEHIMADKEADFILRKEYLPSKEVFAPGEHAEQLFLMTCGAAWNGLFRRSFIEEQGIKFRSFHHADDLGFVYLAYACADTITVMKDKFIHYRKNAGTSQADQVHLWPETSYLALADLKALLEEKVLFEKYKVAFIQIVMVYSIFYLDSMQNWQGYKSLYDELRVRRLFEFGVYDVPDDKFKNKYWLKVRNLIKDVPPEEFVFLQSRGLKPFKEKRLWETIVPVGENVVIYGAGFFGKELFCSMLKDCKYRLKAWVDQNYHSIGYPVISPESLRDITDVWVVVAIISENTYVQVKNYLVSLGIDDSKICWIGRGDD